MIKKFKEQVEVSIETDGKLCGESCKSMNLSDADNSRHDTCFVFKNEELESFIDEEDFEMKILRCDACLQKFGD